MADTTKNMHSTLNDLIETCKDGENGFRNAAEEVKDVELRSMFNRYSAQRAQFAAELQALVEELGGKPEESGSVAAATHRGWMNVKSAVTGRDTAAIISECERGEDVAKESYQKALKHDLPADIRAVVERQYTQVLEAHDTVRRLEIKTH